MRVRTVFQSTCFTCCSNAVALSTAELLFTLVCVSVITVYNVIGSVEIINSFDVKLTIYLSCLFLSILTLTTVADPVGRRGDCHFLTCLLNSLKIHFDHRNNGTYVYS